MTLALKSKLSLYETPPEMNFINALSEELISILKNAFFLNLINESSITSSHEARRSFSSEILD